MCNSVITPVLPCLWMIKVMRMGITHYWQSEVSLHLNSSDTSPKMSFPRTSDLLTPSIPTIPRHICWLAVCLDHHHVNKGGQMELMMYGLCVGHLCTHTQTGSSSSLHGFSWINPRYCTSTQDLSKHPLTGNC